MVVMLVEVGAFVGDEDQFARPSPGLGEQVAHDGDVRGGSRRYDELVDIVYLNTVFRLFFQVVKGCADYLHHVE